MGTNLGMQRGTTLLEILVVAAIAVMMATAAFAFSAGGRPYAMRSAASQFDAAFAYAKAIASTSGDGATMVFAPASPGFTLTVYSGRPDGTSTVLPAGLPPVSSRADVSEATLGSPPFALFVDGAGRVSGQAAYPDLSRGAPVFSTLPAEPACPPGGYVLRFAASAASDMRTLPCPVPAGAP